MLAVKGFTRSDVLVDDGGRHLHGSEALDEHGVAWAGVGVGRVDGLEARPEVVRAAVRTIAGGARTVWGLVAGIAVARHRLKPVVWAVTEARSVPGAHPQRWV